MRVLELAEDDERAASVSEMGLIHNKLRICICTVFTHKSLQRISSATVIMIWTKPMRRSIPVPKGVNKCPL